GETMVTATLEHAFPTLTEEELELLQPMAVCTYLEDGEQAFRAGQADADLFVVKSGALEIQNPSDDHKVVAVHEVGGFSGDIDIIIRRPPIVTGVARGKTHLLRVHRDRLKEVMIKIPHLSEKLLVAFQMRRELLSQSGKIGFKIIGCGLCSDTTLLREFMHKNFVPFTWYDKDTDIGKAAIQRYGEFPIVQKPDGSILVRPDLQDMAHECGLWHECPSQSVDLAIVGAGPAGLAAAVYAASEGLNTIVLDKLGPGGQAGGSSKIENFIGFPSGLSGTELAMRGVLQMVKFGAQLIAPTRVEKFTPGKTAKDPHELTLDCGAVISAKTVLIATGVTWRKLDAINAANYERAGVYYACTNVEVMLHDTQDVAVVGGGNSAGQAAMYLAECCPSRTVHVLCRSKFGPSMSEYLCQRIQATKNIKVHENTKISRVNGGEYLIDNVDIVDASGAEKKLDVKAVFVFIGAEPGATWLPENVQRDQYGFILTGSDAGQSGHWPLKDRMPCALETSVPRLLAAGDIRSGSTKRVGFAVGDGSLAVTCVHSVMPE
ncbi:MAG TPA: FAD-dependent oxidoreductase, partial [Candidatus Melainabacteria bacterium]|nr:FAD-dependent oxidoreductase [Candidatus Melainabacteria bacterium]